MHRCSYMLLKEVRDILNADQLTLKPMEAREASIAYIRKDPLPHVKLPPKQSPQKKQDIARMIEKAIPGLRHEGYLEVADMLGAAHRYEKRIGILREWCLFQERDHGKLEEREFPKFGNGGGG